MTLTAGYIYGTRRPGRKRVTLPTNSRNPFGLAIAPDGRTVALPNGSTLALWDLGSLRLKRVLQSHEATVQLPVFGSDGSVLVTASYDGSVRLWDFPVLDEPGSLRAGGGALR